MVKVVHVKGVAFRVETEVTPSRKRFGLACYDKDSCEVRFCKESDRFVEGNFTEANIMLGTTPRKRLIRECKNMDCKRRISFSRAPIKVCRNCEYIEVQEGIRIYHVPPVANCKKYIEEAVRSKSGYGKPYGRQDRVFRRGGQDHWYGGHKV
jgi:hypothetical protein